MLRTDSRFLFSQKLAIHLIFREIVLIGFGALFLSLCAQISLPLGFTPVPLSLQTFGIMLIATMGGVRLGVGSVAFYLLFIALGLPVLACGNTEPTFLLGVRAGYGFGWFIQSYLDGYFGERFRKDRSSVKLFLGLVAGSVTTLLLGSLWLGVLLGWKMGLVLGFLPFLPGDLLKTIVATQVNRKLIKKDISTYRLPDVNVDF